MQALTAFIRDEEGFTGAEKAIITLIAVGIVVVIGNLIYQGTKTAANTASTQIAGQQATTQTVQW